VKRISGKRVEKGLPVLEPPCPEIPPPAIDAREDIRLEINLDMRLDILLFS
jgi:hypothetical protein